jgi:outer membrane protein, heavy metal efflux system
MKNCFLICSSLIVLLSPGLAAERPGTATNAVLLTSALIDALAEEALTNHPALRAADLRADAALWNAAAVRSWEDPMAKFGIMGADRERRADDGDLIYGAEQRLPLFGKPGAARALAQSEAGMRRQEAAFRALEIRRDLVKQLLKVALIDRELELSRDDVASLDTIVAATEDKYRNGLATQVEVLQTQNARAQRANLLRTAESLRGAAEASLNRFLSRKIDQPWPGLILPEPVAALPPARELILQATEAAPQLDVMRASLRQAESSLVLARKQRLPDLSVGVEGRQFADTGEFREGVVTLGVSIPWGNRSRYAADVKREQRKLEAAQLDIADMQLALRDEISRLTIQIDNARRESALYRTDIIPRTQQALDGARANWLNNRGTLRDVLEARRMLLEAQTIEARAISEQHSMLADLLLHCGRGEFGNLQQSTAAPSSVPPKKDLP